jgi:hypothetical protein
MRSRARIVCITVVVAGWSLAARAASAAPTVSLSPAPANVQLGQSTTVSLSGSSFTQTTEGGGVSLHFDPTRVHVTNVTIDTTTWEFFTSVGAIDNTNGVVNNIVFASFAGRSGNFPIATITFQAVGVGTAALSLTESTTNPFASGGQHLAVTLGTGSVVVSSSTNQSVPVSPAAAAFLGLVLLGLGWRLIVSHRRA